MRKRGVPGKGGVFGKKEWSQGLQWEILVNMKDRRGISC